MSTSGVREPPANIEDKQGKMSRTWRIDKERRQRLLRELARIISFCPRLNIKKLILCGSTVRGEVVATSDLDLLAVQETTLSFMDRLEEFFASVQPRVQVDVLIYTPEELKALAARPFIRRMIEEGEVVYEENSGRGS